MNSFSGTVGETTLTEAQLTAHTHEYQRCSGTGSGVGGGGIARSNVPTGTTGGSQSHSHDFVGSTSQSDVLPPYYAISYIMRII